MVPALRTTGKFCGKQFKRAFARARLTSLLSATPIAFVSITFLAARVGLMGGASTESSGFAAESPQPEPEIRSPADRELEQEARKFFETLLRKTAHLSLAERMDVVSASLLGKAYRFDPFGEGEGAPFDDHPRFRHDTFDCTTYVETVLGASLADSLSDFIATMDRIRYRNGEVSFATRNHFTSVDWIPNLERAHLATDVTKDIAQAACLSGGNDEFAAIPCTPKTAIARIDKRNWYLKLPLARLQIRGLTDEPTPTEEQSRQITAKLAQLRSLGQEMESEVSRLPYLSFSDIVSPNQSINQAVLNELRTGMIVNLVAPGLDKTEEIGTQLNVVHQGLLVEKAGEFYFRNAASVSRGVEEVTLKFALLKWRNSQIVKGINIVQPKGL